MTGLVAKADCPRTAYSSVSALRLMALVALMALASGCATLPHRELPPPTYATTHFESTALYQMTAGLVPADDRSGFRLLPVASAAFETRIALVHAAEQTLDVQYYLFKNDNTGRSLMRELRDAAARGVRVRILIDDLYTVGEDEVLSDLATFPNVEVRLFNPFVSWRDNRFTRLMGAALELARVDRRMHNKLFIADNAAAVMGGRNIADEYFMRASGANFVDIDLFVAGPAVRALSSAFDRFWNSALVVPVRHLDGPRHDPGKAALEFDRLTRDAISPPHEDLPEPFRGLGALPGEIAARHISSLIVAKATVLADFPDKSTAQSDVTFPTVTRAVLGILAQAKREVDIVSPYFVPGDIGMRMMHDAHVNGGRTVLITNSLASTDSPLAEMGYIRYRKAMLEEGVIIRELSPSLARDRHNFGSFGSSSAGLHAKVVVVDKQLVFIGSMNLDFRSAYENTEIGIIVDSPEIANSLLVLVDDGSFYDLRLSPAGTVEWVSTTDKKTKTFDSDPETDWLGRLIPELLEPFVPEEEL
jgi:putative cardiolipin synthase